MFPLADLAASQAVMAQWPGRGSEAFRAPVARRGCVIDIETAPDRYALVLSGRRGRAPQGSPLNEVVAISVLDFDEDGRGVCSGMRLRSFHRDEYSERDMLVNADALVGAVVDGGGVLVTFNGASFDIPALRVRMMRWWLAGRGGIASVAEGHPAHVDVMLALSAGGLGRWPSLADACASVGFSLKGATRVGSNRLVPYEVEKCELDVIGTLAMYLHVSAFARGSDEPLRLGLPSLGREMRAIAAGRPHLERFALSPTLEAGKGVWGASGRAVNVDTKAGHVR